MTFITGSITNANPGPTLYALIETAALADGWTLDDTVVIGGNTHKVLKSAAAGNTYALDWFLDINYPTTGITGGMRFAPFEGYTAASDVATRGPYATNDATIEATNYSRYGATTHALETNWTNSASVTTMSATLSTSAFTYWVSITRNRIIVMTSLQTNAFFYGGFFTPTTAHSTQAAASLFPLIMTTVFVSSSSNSATSTASSAAALTRAPKVTSGWNWSTSVRIDPRESAALLGGQIGVANSPLTGQAVMVPIPIMAGTNTTAYSTATTAAHIGYLDGVASGFVASGAVRGDSVTVGSDTWYAAAPSSSYTNFFKGA